MIDAIESKITQVNVTKKLISYKKLITVSVFICPKSRKENIMGYIAFIFRSPRYGKMTKVVIDDYGEIVKLKF